MFKLWCRYLFEIGEAFTCGSKSKANRKPERLLNIQRVRKRSVSPTVRVCHTDLPVSYPVTP